MEAVEIRLPKDVNALRIKHLPALTDPDFSIESLDIGTRARFLEKMTGAKPGSFLKHRTVDVNEAFYHCIDLFAQCEKIKKPEKVIKVQGKTFELVDPHRVASGWHIDAGNPDHNLEKEPARLAALMYIEKGVTYGLEDGNRNIVHPLSERTAFFEEHLPLQYFIGAQGFFLRKSERLIPAFTLLQLARQQNRVINPKSPSRSFLSSGQKRLTRFLRNLTFHGTKLRR